MLSMLGNQDGTGRGPQRTAPGDGSAEAAVQSIQAESAADASMLARSSTEVGGLFAQPDAIAASPRTDIDRSSAGSAIRPASNAAMSDPVRPARLHKAIRAGSRSDSRPMAFGYCRVSTDGQAQDGVSLAAQRAKLAAWAEANGYRLVEVFVDAGLSGKRADNRPGLQSALAEVCRHGAALIVYSLSRLARSTRDAIAIAERLDKAGADLVSLTEKLDTTSAAGKMVFRLLAVLSEFERDLASERTTAALAHKRANRGRTGTIPYGWRLATPGSTGKDAFLVEEPGEQSVLARIREWRASGETLREIATRLTTENVPTKEGNAAWTHQAVGKIVARMETAATA